jgi:hypothetical protein
MRRNEPGLTAGSFFLLMIILGILGAGAYMLFSGDVAWGPGR